MPYLASALVVLVSTICRAQKTSLDDHAPGAQVLLASMATPLERVAPQLVTAENPPNYELDGMDSDRCIALHNAILEHAWTASGRTSEDFLANTETWWNTYGDVVEADKFHSSVRLFLEGARIVPHGYKPDTSFFFNVRGLHHPTRFWEGPLSSIYEDNAILTLYASDEPLAGTPDGMLYNQVNHNAMMHFDVEDDCVDDFDRWVKLESMLTVWIEMIIRQKIVALPPEVGFEKWEKDADGVFQLRQGPERDPVTGAKRMQDELSPWTAQPWTSQDMVDSLRVWSWAVQAIEKRMGLDMNVECIAGIYDAATLDKAQIPEGFARQFLLRARKPRFENIAPGLRISGPDGFVDQPFIELNARAPLPVPEPGDDGIAPILLFRSNHTISSLDSPFFYPYSGPDAITSNCVCGLWFQVCDRRYGLPVEDGVGLVLPYRFEGAWAKQSDLSPATGPADLLQHGMNPYNTGHPPQLQAFLETVLTNVHAGIWKVDANGVAGGIDVWREADTEERWGDYIVGIGPGMFW